MEEIETILERLSRSAESPLPFRLNEAKPLLLDFSASNAMIRSMDGSQLAEFVAGLLSRAGSGLGIGAYGEDRVIYSRSPIFGSERSIHLGMDLIVTAGTPVFSPLRGVVHSFRDNRRQGDYGPTVIIEHNIHGRTFFTLFGHLSPESLLKEEGDAIDKGGVIGSVGIIEVNGGWFEHVHFQIITDMGGRKGDFPGVSSRGDWPKYRRLCPDPNVLLGVKALNKGMKR